MRVSGDYDDLFDWLYKRAIIGLIVAAVGIAAIGFAIGYCVG